MARIAKRVVPAHCEECGLNFRVVDGMAAELFCPRCNMASPRVQSSAWPDSTEAPDGQHPRDRPSGR
jgi:hypothetical protein